MALQQVGAEKINYWMTCPMKTSSFVEVISIPKVTGESVCDIAASGDEASAKVRKPYTITKQRERWTEEEHQKFLDALKLYGRAWRRIEEHIGTKTAVQIRSHAQKFFSKLEREASMGGSSATGASQDIEIPPPRPKRKPSHPYPRKAGGAFSSSPSFEDDSKSSPTVCSAFTPLGSPPGLLARKPSEDMTQNIISTQSRSSFMKPLDLKGASHQKHGLPASLRLFGQTVIVPDSDVPGADTERQFEAPNSHVLNASESTGSPRSDISMEGEEISGISSIRSSKIEAEAYKKTDILRQPEGSGENTDSESSEAGVSETNEGPQVWEKVSDTARGVKEITQRGDKMNMDCSGDLDKSNDSTATSCTSSSPIPSLSPSPVPLNRPSDLLHRSHTLAGTNTGGSCFTPWHPSQVLPKQHPKFWQGLFSEKGTDNTDVAVAAATFSIASAWHAIQGGIPTAIGYPTVGMVYNPVAIVTAPTRPAFGSATEYFESSLPPKQHANADATCADTREKLGGNHKCSAGSKDGIQVGNDESVIASTGEGCSNLTDRFTFSNHGNTSDHVEGTQSRKRFRCPHENDMQEACRLSSCSPSHDWPVNYCGRGENINGSLSIESDSEALLNNSSGNIILQNHCSVEGLLQSQSEVKNLQTISREREDTAEQQKEMHNQTKLVLESLHARDTIHPTSQSDSKKGAKQVETSEENQQCNGQSRENLQSPPTDSMVDPKSEVISSEETGKNSWSAELKEKDVGNGGCIGTGKHLFMLKTGGFILSSRYSGVGFVPYKRSKLVDKVTVHQ